jgi:putative serine protease PepD
VGAPEEASGTTATLTRPEPWGGPPPVDTTGRPTGTGPRGPATWVIVLAVAVVAALIGGGVGGVVGWRAADKATGIDSGASLGAAPRTVVERPAGSVAAIAAKVLPSVVSIKVTTGVGGDTGSGIILRSDGYILTNNHVVSDAINGGGTITVSFADQRTAQATVVGHDTTSDLAVIRVRGVDNLKPAALGNSDKLAVGDTVIAVGSPLGLAGTVTSGIVSALDRPVSAGDQSSPANASSFIDAIQTDAAINPGNSGGPLVDSSGSVVGINSAIATLGGSPLGGGQSGSIGLGFAIPINQARTIAEEIVRTGHSTHAVIGVWLDFSYSGNPPGARIGSDPRGGPGIIAGGPAEKSGLKEGDIITAINGQRITGADELVVQIRKHRPGDTITLTYVRGGKTGTAKVTLGGSTSD